MNRFAVSLLAALVALSGCADQDQARDHGQGQEQPSKSERGNITKAIGEPAIYGTGKCADEDCVTFTVDSLDWVDTCEYPLGDIEGDLLNVTLNASTSTALDPSQSVGMFQTYNWAVVDAEGVTRSNASGGIMTPCNPDPDGLGGEISPGSKYSGVLQFDVPPGSTHLILDVFGDASWEWALPSPPSGS